MSPTTRELIIRGARQHTGRVAVVFGEQELTFGAVDELSNRLAHALAREGAGHHRRVGLLVNNGLLSVPLDFACVKGGINRVPLNSRLSVAEHVTMLTDTRCELVVFGADLTDRARELAAALPDVTFLGLETGLDGEPSLMERAESVPATLPEVEVGPDDVILTLYTSGTTGTLKAAQHTQASYAGICRNVLLNLLPATRDDVMLHAASLIHASGVFVLPLWLRGGRTVILPGFAPERFLAAVTRHGATAINLVPTMIQMLVEHPAFTATDVSTLRRVIYGASPMPRPVIERAMGAWGRERFWQYYGQTEIPLCIAVLRPEDHTGDRLAACGQVAADVDLRLLDEDGRPVRPGEPGEIVVRGPSACAGYFNAPELTADTFRDGWVHTRDVGVLDEDGFLFLKDRTSDMIISGGYNVYPREVEDVLLEHPAVREAAVVGTPDERWVEAVTAVVVLTEGTAPGDDLRERLIAHVTERVASYKKPRKIIFVDAVPKTAVGKLDRKTLRAEFARTATTP
ncbi:AMP-binding protein [Actinomadura sp. 6K520]|uniref:AMP-binding protein n=1 Tax=Actinomadura sp. 6K520 TaxID=2530364 RepID=UPI00104B0423|nr:AMP-binding protein [Actinomadura sp. 6K520]TDE20881.1 long-chain fatty acid--CoA ligase [Actinomadura sp. 6K520]